LPVGGSGQAAPGLPGDASLDRRRPIHNHLVVDSLSATLAAVADPTRRSILRRLADGPAAVRDLAKPYRISQQAVSKHLACLQRARLIGKRRDGRLQICTLDPRPLQEVAEWTEGYRKFWERRFARLDALLDELQHKDRRKPPRR
jgi:DNA-binding transcriptional ArsR family regulator